EYLVPVDLAIAAAPWRIFFSLTGGREPGRQGLPDPGFAVRRAPLKPAAHGRLRFQLGKASKARVYPSPGKWGANLPDAEPNQAGTPSRRKFASFGMPAHRFKRLQSASPYNARRHPAAKPRKETRKL